MKDIMQSRLSSEKKNPVFGGYFYNLTKGRLKLDQVIDEILAYIESETDNFYDIIIGCDSSSEKVPNFPVAIVVLKMGEGGRFFLKKISYKNRKFHSWRERILEEVLLSCKLALLFKEKLEKRIESKDKNYNYRFCYIHADIGENGGTKDMIKEVVGLIRGNGFEPKIKPEAYVASSVADRYA
ncbi:MAG: ribonuclease H-like YkuK family protein [Candidatus Nealsonbacteria bacterium]